MRKRILSLLLCVVMLFSLCPQSALAVGNEQTGGVTIGTSGLCEHHPEHDADCGYTEGTAGTSCGHEHTEDCYVEVTNCVHEHDEDCYPAGSVSGNEATPSGAQKREPENCPHICDEESGCITKELNCHHEHDGECGYSPAIEGTPCGYVCELCGGEDNGEAGKQPEEECICTTLCTTEAIEEDCPVCGVENADLTLCEGEAKTATPSNAETITVALAAGPVTDVSYLDETSTSQTCDSATEVTSSDTGWTTDWYVVQGTVEIGSRVTVSGDVRLILADGCTLTVNGGIQVQDDDDDITNGSANALTIYAQSTDESTMGKLIAKGAEDDYNAVIGGNEGNDYGGSGGAVTINGGVVKAISTDGAGIGGGFGSRSGGSGGTITINGGNITASSQFGAGIGGGEGVSCGGSGGEITINGGSVIATGVNGAGIGGGQGDGGGEDYGGSGGTITITGGYVEAKSNMGAAIGGGYNGGGGTGGDGGKITITGGNTTASGYYCTAIGGGFGDYGGSGGKITITGGTVTATGNASGKASSSSAAGIGGGRYNFPSGTDGTFQTTNNGNAVIFASSIGDQSHKDDWSGIIFEGNEGEVYGNPTLADDLTIPENKALDIPSGKTLTVNSTITVQGTLANNGTIIGSGSITPDEKKLTYKAAPSTPVIDSVSADSITLRPITGETAVEYSKDNTNWQSGTTFSGLTAATSYTFYARYQANGFYKGASPQSDGSTPTYIAYYDGPAIVIGTDGISGYSDDGGYHFIYFGNWEAPDSNTTSGPIRWRVLDDQTNTGESGLFLLSDVLLGKGSRGGVYFDNTSRFSNAWQGSSAQAWCRDFAGESGAESNVNDAFTADELGVILSTSKSDAEFDSEHHTFCASENILSGDRVFFLSAEEAENDEYGFTDDAAQVANYGTSAGGWWLRSFLNEHDLPFAGSIGDRGRVGEEGVINPWAARPAFNLNTSSVLFTSAAAGGKADTAVDENLTAVGTGTGEWKLTLLDNSRKSFTASAGTGTALMQKPGYSDWTVSIDYSGAPTGANEYVSAMLADESGASLYYGRIVSGSASGTARVTIPAGLAPGSYTLKVFSEQYNGDKQTDYASAFENINLTVGYKEQFSLAPGSTYYFDLSGADIPGDKNGSLPDGSLHWVPFTYAGTVNAYVLKSRSANDNTARGDSANAAGSTDPDNPIGYTYDHSLFIADYNVTRSANWHNLNAKNLIFGKAYTSGGVDYTLRAPSAGSSGTASGGTPASNEWDAILDKANQSYQDNTVGYIKNWNGMYSWGQDTHDSLDSDWNRATRGSSTARSWQFDLKLSPTVGFRPVLELPSSDTLGSDGLKAITLDLNGGKIGGNSDDIQIIVKNGSAFTAPASGGLTRPDGDTGSFFMWLGSDGKLYAPGANVPADVTKLTAQFTLSEQFSLTPGGVYYFDLSGVSIPGTANSGNSYGATSLPDTTLHYVPFTYAGTIEAYKLTSEMATTEEYAEQNKYPHSLFVANYAVTHTVSWYELNAAGLIFGKSYTGGSVDYTLRAPSVGSNYTGSGNSERGVPQSNEWDMMLGKNEDYIKNWICMGSLGQDTSSKYSDRRAIRGYDSARYLNYFNATYQYAYVGFRPVLEVLNADTLGADGLKAVALDLNGGKLGGSADDIQIIVKNGSAFTAPVSDGLTRPDGDTGSYFMWLDGNGNSYEPGDSVPADVTELTVQWTAPTYTVTLNGVNSDATGAGNYAVGVTVNIYAGTKSGYSFNGWTSDNVTITNANNKNASFTMPAKDVTVTANWTKNSSGGTGHIYYTIKATAGEGGKITPSGNATVLYGRNKTFTITPDNGYAIADVKIDGQSIGAVKTYTFERVRGDHTIEAVFMKATGNPQTGVDVPFTDVSETDWFYADVAYVYANGLMAGTSVTTFSPNVTTTRGMIVTILYRLEGEPAISVDCPFDDVKSGSYYEKAIIWAAAKGIVSGYGSDLFGPDDPITREQMAVILFRYAQYKGLDVSAGEDTNILSYSDALDIPEYAFPAMQWICGVSILNGSDGNLMPRGSAIRAQVAAILHRFCENILK